MSKAVRAAVEATTDYAERVLRRNKLNKSIADIAKRRDVDIDKSPKVIVDDSHEVGSKGLGIGIAVVGGLTFLTLIRKK